MTFVSSKQNKDDMKRTVLFYLLLLLTGTVTAQGRFPKHQLGINAFRNPSIGIEYGYRQVSVHAGYYITAFTSGVTTQFVKTGVTYWFLPTDKKPIPSSFYAGVSYLRGLNRDYKNIDAFGAEAGFRWMAWSSAAPRRWMRRC